MSLELLRDDALPYREYLLRPGDALDFGFDWSRWLANARRSGAAVAAGYCIRPGKPNGFEYVATAGVTGSEEPVWPTEIGASVDDGSVSWVCQAASSSSLASLVSSAVWTPDSPVTVSDQTVLSGNITAARITVPALAPDGDYYVFCKMTTVAAKAKTGTLLMRVRARAA